MYTRHRFRARCSAAPRRQGHSRRHCRRSTFTFTFILTHPGILPYTFAPRGLYPPINVDGLGTYTHVRTLHACILPRDVPRLPPPATRQLTSRPLDPLRIGPGSAPHLALSFARVGCPPERPLDECVCACVHRTESSPCCSDAAASTGPRLWVVPPPPPGPVRGPPRLRTRGRSGLARPGG